MYLDKKTATRMDQPVIGGQKVTSVTSNALKVTSLKFNFFLENL